MSDVDIFHAPRDFEFHDFDTRNVTASDGGTATLRFPRLDAASACTATLRFPRLDADAVHALAASVRRHRMHGDVAFPPSRRRQRMHGIAPRNWRGIPRTGSST